MILTECKGLAVVVLDKKDYIDKAQDLLADKDTYRLITGDPIIKHKNRLIQILKFIKAQDELGDAMYKRLYHTSEVPPNSMYS